MTSPEDREANSCVTSLFFFLHVGKVHGSLARAGKVRGQTPKVPKQEKKKKPTGRAMKRVKYTRRFLNVGESTFSSSSGCSTGPCRGGVTTNFFACLSVFCSLS